MKHAKNTIISIVLLNVSILLMGFKSKEDPILEDINAAYLPSFSEIYSWHLYKDKGGSTLSGTKSWRRYVRFIEKKLKNYKVKGITKNEWVYDRWYTSGSTDEMSLTIGGEKIRVAQYGAYSGSTKPNGVTGNVIVYDPRRKPADFKNKILAFVIKPQSGVALSDSFKLRFTLNDYEYVSDRRDVPKIQTKIPARQSITFDTWWQLQQTAKINKILKTSGAVAGVIIFDMPYERLNGLYTFPVPRKTQSVPTLYLDRKAGAKFLSKLDFGNVKANLKLIATTEKTKTYQLIGYLPGKNFGKKNDKQIMLLTHTDGPSISQDNGALGILAIAKYFSRFPKNERDKTLLLFFDNRHYMPGMEAAFEEQSWFKRNPKSKKKVVAIISPEHLGQMEYRDQNQGLRRTGKPEVTLLWSRNNQTQINLAADAVRKHKLPRTFVQSVERKGIHGLPQGIWYGLGSLALKWDIPGYGLMGMQGAYWTTSARINKFDTDHFNKQVLVLVQITANLMIKDLNEGEQQ